MILNTRESGNVTILDLEGRFVIGSDEGLLMDKVRELLGFGHRRFLLNLAELETMDSTGLGELVATKKLADEHEAALKLLRPQGRVAETLRLTLLLPLFEVHDEEDEGVSSFA